MTRLVLALNTSDRNRALEMLRRFGDRIDCYKIGIDLFAAAGPELVREFVSAGADVFLDLKYSDIPSVVGKAVTVAARLGAKLLTVHTMGGAKMLAEAARAARVVGPQRPLILGVTVLTSLDRAGLEQVTGRDEEVGNRVLALARLAQSTGCDGVVASPEEIRVLKSECGPGFVVVTPGIRMSPAAGRDDQARTMTPAEAARAGADYIVVGRPVYEAAEPLEVIAEIRRQLGG
uniref:Orotidine 5'-phosphate decarboxylase n=1 Tax=candidate division WOR-3 bacterium TaxID=2052148 RepID=A0A7C4GGH6_UNCW3